MDLKRLSSTLLITGLVMMAVMYWQHSHADAQKNVATPSVVADAMATPPVNHDVPATANNSIAPAVAAATMENVPPPPPPTVPEKITLGSAEHGAPYKLELVVNNVNASVERLRLNIDQYAETVKKEQPLTLLQADHTYGAEPFATTTVYSTEKRPPYEAGKVPLWFDLRGVTWHIDREHTSATKATLYLILYSDLGMKMPWVRVEKIFQIDPMSYEVTISHHVKNLTGENTNVMIDQRGPINLWNKPPDDFRTDSRMYQTATYNKDIEALFTEKDNTKLVSQAILGKVGSKIEDLGSFIGTDRVVWIAASNRFFTSIVRPLPNAGAPADPLKDGRSIPETDFLDRAQAEPLYQDSATPANAVTCVSLFGKSVTVAGGGDREMKLSVYMGPKKKQILEGDASAPAGSLANTCELYQYRDVIQYSRGSCSFLTFAPVARLILWLLDMIQKVTFNWGVAIIILVIVVRLLLHPLTRYSQVSMATMQQKMASVAPELEIIKKKYPKDNARQQQEKMRVFKENNINPAGSIFGCLPMLLQMPIWAALYAGLAIDIDLRQASFIPGWINDLSNPDMVMGNINLPVFTIPMVGIPIYGLNVLPLLLGLVFFFQMRISMNQQKQLKAGQPKTEMDEQQAQTQNMSQFMFLLFPIMLYNAPSGLNLYIFASSVAGFFDTWLIRRHMKEKGIIPGADGAVVVSPH